MITPNTPAHPAPSLFAPATAAHAPRVCVIAEIGVNHDGCPKRAADLIRAAKSAGADAVKFQLFDPRRLLSNQAILAEYQKSSATDVFAMLDGLKLSLQQMVPLRELAAELGVLFIVTPFSLQDAADLEKLQPDAVKIASPDAVNFPLLEQAAAIGQPMIISTGTCEIEELQYAANLIKNQQTSGGGGGALLQCVSSYPTPVEEAGLGAISVLAHRFNLPIGYSDHTADLLTGSLAVAAGACVIEKHLTYDVTASGPDHSASLAPDTFARYVQMIRQSAASLGPRAKRISPVEADVRVVSRQSVCAAIDLPAGKTLTAADLTVKRPGTGIPAQRFSEVLGRKISRAIKANDLLQEADLA